MESIKETIDLSVRRLDVDLTSDTYLSNLGVTTMRLVKQQDSYIDLSFSVDIKFMSQNYKKMYEEANASSIKLSSIFTQVLHSDSKKCRLTYRLDSKNYPLGEKDKIDYVLLRNLDFSKSTGLDALRYELSTTPIRYMYTYDDDEHVLVETDDKIREYIKYGIILHSTRDLEVLRIDTNDISACKSLLNRMFKESYNCDSMFTVINIDNVNVTSSNDVKKLLRGLYSTVSKQDNTFNVNIGIGIDSRTRYFWDDYDVYNLIEMLEDYNIYFPELDFRLENPTESWYGCLE
jgi:hypothetical protein